MKDLTISQKNYLHTLVCGQHINILKYMVHVLLFAATLHALDYELSYRLHAAFDKKISDLRQLSSQHLITPFENQWKI